MLYVNTPFLAKQAMFAQAAALGASTIRLDIGLSAVFMNPAGPPDWTGVDDYMRLARRYHLHVLADLLATPWYLADCPTSAVNAPSYLCPPTRPADWGRDAGLIAAHTRGVIDNFEIINEADGSWAFLGTPQQYAQILAASYTAIHASDSHAEVVLGGLMNVASYQWIDAMLTTTGAKALHKFDIANVHVRTSAGQAAATVGRWRRFFTHKGFPGPLWITETGYPANPAYQTDAGYQHGPSSQARWLAHVIPAMLRAGAQMVFVTERDSMSGRFASEGILQTPSPLTDNPKVTRRPSFYAVRTLARANEPDQVPRRRGL